MNFDTDFAERFKNLELVDDLQLAKRMIKLRISERKKLTEYGFEFNMHKKNQKKRFKKKTEFIVKKYKPKQEHTHNYDEFEVKGWLKCKICNHLKKEEPKRMPTNTSTYKEEYQFTRKTINGMNMLEYHEFKNQNRPKFNDVDKCRHSWKEDSFTLDMFCIYCMEIKPNIINKEEYNDGAKIKIWNRIYNRGETDIKHLECMRGDLNEKINNQTWLYILKEVPETFIWLDVFNVFKKYNLHDYWMGFGAFIYLKPEINKEIIAMADKYTNEIKESKNRISYLYLIYKFCQIEGNKNKNYGQAKYIPMKMSKLWLQKTDIWWKKICERDNLMFIPSCIYRVKWMKQEFLRNFIEGLEDLGLNTNL